MTLTAPKFTLSRSDAADLLAVSTRTIDRYIRGKRLSARKKAGNILLSEEEVNNLKVTLFQNMHGASPEMEGRAHRHIDSVAARQSSTIFDAETGTVEESEATEEVAVMQAPKAVAVKSDRENVFEELYDLSRREVREYHNKLEAANYRLGQLEVQVKHSVPLLDYQEKEQAIRQQDEIIQSKVRRQDETIQIMEHEVKSERLNKNIYIGLLFGLLTLQPVLWLLLNS